MTIWSSCSFHFCLFPARRRKKATDSCRTINFWQLLATSDRHAGSRTALLLRQYRHIPAAGRRSYPILIHRAPVSTQGNRAQPLSARHACLFLKSFSVNTENKHQPEDHNVKTSGAKMCRTATCKAKTCPARSFRAETFRNALGHLPRQGDERKAGRCHRMGT